MQAAPSAHDLGAEIIDDIEHNRIQLPTLPEVALKVRDEVESETATAASVADMIANDAALSARLLQVANSPLYRGRNPIDNIQMAITRMGLTMVRNLVVSLAMKQIFQATSDALDHQFRKVWEDSVEVAAISRLLASSLPQIENEQAMLGGLIHNIGALPVLTKLDTLLDHEADEQLIQQLVDELSPQLGLSILEHWNFNEKLAHIPLECLKLDRDPGAAADYADVVLVARQQHLASSGQPELMQSWDRIPAFGKVGLETEVIVVDMEGPAGEIAEVRDMLTP